MSDPVEILPRHPLMWTTREDGVLQIPNLHTGEIVRYSPATERNLRAVQDARDLKEYLKRCGDLDARAAAQARAFLFALATMGYVELCAPPLTGYDVVRQLGAGAVGVAFLCRVDGREVVVKRAWDAVTPLASAHAALRREADALGALAHARIPALIGIREHEGRLHLLRAYVDGVPLTPDPALVPEALALLAHVHARGHLLVDHAPWNYLRAREGLVLLDVGHARPAPPEGLQLARAAGTPGYIAPETQASGALTRASDVWGAGRLVAYLLHGRSAFKHDTLEGIVAGLAPEDERFVRAACAADPSQRPADGAEALQSWNDAHARRQA